MKRDIDMPDSFIVQFDTRDPMQAIYIHDCVTGSLLGLDNPHLFRVATYWSDAAGSGDPSDYSSLMLRTLTLWTALLADPLVQRFVLRGADCGELTERSMAPPREEKSVVITFPPPSPATLVPPGPHTTRDEFVHADLAGRGSTEEVGTLTISKDSPLIAAARVRRVFVSSSSTSPEWHAEGPVGFDRPFLPDHAEEDAIGMVYELALCATHKSAKAARRWMEEAFPNEIHAHLERRGLPIPERVARVLKARLEKDEDAEVSLW